jgi:hypothetical protein
MASAAEEAGDLGLDLLRLGAGVGGLPDGAAHDDVVRPAKERVLDVHGALLVVGRPVLDRPDSGANDQEIAPEFTPQAGRLESRGDHPVAAQLQRPPRPREDEFLGVALESEVVQVPPVEAREDCDREDLDLALRRNGGLEHGSLPWTVAKATLRCLSCSTASLTVSGTSKNLMSAKTFFPCASSQSIMSKYWPVMRNCSPSL